MTNTLPLQSEAYGRLIAGIKNGSANEIDQALAHYEKLDSEDLFDHSHPKINALARCDVLKAKLREIKDHLLDPKKLALLSGKVAIAPDIAAYLIKHSPESECRRIINAIMLDKTMHYLKIEVFTDRDVRFPIYDGEKLLELVNVCHQKDKTGALVTHLMEEIIKGNEISSLNTDAVSFVRLQHAIHMIEDMHGKERTNFIVEAMKNNLERVVINEQVKDRAYSWADLLHEMPERTINDLMLLQQVGLIDVAKQILESAGKHSQSRVVFSKIGHSWHTPKTPEYAFIEALGADGLYGLLSSAIVYGQEIHKTDHLVDLYEVYRAFEINPTSPEVTKKPHRLTTFGVMGHYYNVHNDKDKKDWAVKCISESTENMKPKDIDRLLTQGKSYISKEIALQIPHLKKAQLGSDFGM